MAGHAWFIYSLTAALCWGLGYVLDDKLLRQGLTPSVLMVFHSILGIPVFLTLAISRGEMKSSLAILGQGVSAWALLFFALALGCFGNFMILSGIAEKNATLASFVEISYPLFAFVFACFILKESQLNLATGFGALLILSGIAVIYLKN